MAGALRGLTGNPSEKCVEFSATVVPGPARNGRPYGQSAVTLQRESWLQRERASRRFYDRLMALTALVCLGMLGLSGWLLSRAAEPGTLLLRR